MYTRWTGIGGLEFDRPEKNSLRPLAHFVIAAGALTATALPLRAAEQITLRNGFEITCNHHGTANRRVRLYMEKVNQNYIEVAPGDIARWNFPIRLLREFRSPNCAPVADLGATLS